MTPKHFDSYLVQMHCVNSGLMPISVIFHALLMLMHKDLQNVKTDFKSTWVSLNEKKYSICFIMAINAVKLMRRSSPLLLQCSVLLDYNKRHQKLVWPNPTII